MMYEELDKLTLGGLQELAMKHWIERQDDYRRAKERLEKVLDWIAHAPLQPGGSEPPLSFYAHELPEAWEGLEGARDSLKRQFCESMGISSGTE
jgi:hypothetical protein